MPSVSSGDLAAAVDVARVLALARRRGPTARRSATSVADARRRVRCAGGSSRPRCGVADPLRGGGAAVAAERRRFAPPCTRAACAGSGFAAVEARRLRRRVRRCGVPSVRRHGASRSLLAGRAPAAGARRAGPSAGAHAGASGRRRGASCTFQSWPASIAPAVRQPSSRAAARARDRRGPRRMVQREPQGRAAVELATHRQHFDQALVGTHARRCRR